MVKAANEFDCELGGEVQEVNTSGKPEDTVVCRSLQSFIKINDRQPLYHDPDC